MTPHSARKLPYRSTFGSRNSPRVGLWISGPVVGYKKADHRLAPTGKASRQPLTGQRGGEHGIGPDPISCPVPSHSEGREEPSVPSAPHHDAPVGDRKDVLPEFVGRPEGPKHLEIGPKASFDVALCRLLGFLRTGSNWDLFLPRLRSILLGEHLGVDRREEPLEGRSRLDDSQPCDRQPDDCLPRLPQCSDAPSARTAPARASNTSGNQSQSKDASTIRERTSTALSK